LSIPVALIEPGSDLATALYVVAFSLFIIGVRRGTHPTTAKQGNLIAAIGMAIAVVTTLLLDGIGNWGLLIGGLVIGAAIGIVASSRVQMTAMPQMVALYNGVGGGAVALIAWSEFREFLTIGEEIPLDELIPILFSMVIGSISFWGSNIAFGKLQGLIPGQPIKVPGQQVINAVPAWPSWSTTRARRRDCSSRCWSRRRCWATSSCCRSAAPTCPW
jgi:proton-translocating NAD(P)+ transhydrogenase subunit beta